MSHHVWVVIGFHSEEAADRWAAGRLPVLSETEACSILLTRPTDEVVRWVQAEQEWHDTKDAMRGA